MTLRSRFTLALTAVGIFVFGSYALWAYFSERAELRAAATRELAIIGRSLETALGNALRDNQAADVIETLATLETLAPDLDVHVHNAAGGSLARSPGAVPELAIEVAATTARESRAERTTLDREASEPRLIFSAALLSEGTLLGSLSIVRPVDDLTADLSRTRDRLIVMVALFLIATMATGSVLGTIHVSRPIARLLDGIRHVREGNFRNRVRSGHHDELGRLVAEFNSMIGALADERARRETETEARTRLERGLQNVDKLVTIGQLSAGLAHEIGSPLQVLSGRASVLLGHSDPEVRRQAEQLVAQCVRITRIVEQLLSFGRRKAALISPCDLVVSVRAVLELLAGEARRRGVNLVLDTDAGPHFIDGDRDQLQQIALNLIRNALAATPRDGKVVVRVDRLHQLVRISVRDTGAGIDADVRARLFEPFFTTRAAEGGTGLGLSVVKAIADEHRATVDVFSEAGGGAEFVVSFAAREEGSRG